MRKKEFDVSIIIPVYNRKYKIKRAINSVLKQTYNNWELIIVDDGSMDGIEKILFPLLKKYPDFKYIRHSNRKTALSLNTGIKISEGKYITFLDSDDEYKNGHLKSRMDFFKVNKNVDLIHSNCTLIGKEKDMYVPDARNKKRLIHLNKCIIGATLFGKKEVFEKLQGFKNVYSYDSEFYRRTKKLFNVSKLDSPTYIYYRDSKDSVLAKTKNIFYKNEG
jgi:glycosyltransferase involved in cell wall biosynthesis